MSYRLVRTDSTMINPSDEYNNPNSPIGEVIMSPRKRFSILSCLCDEIKRNIKLVEPIYRTVKQVKI